MSSDKIFDKLAADERRQPQTFSPADFLNPAAGAWPD